MDLDRTQSNNVTEFTAQNDEDQGYPGPLDDFWYQDFYGHLLKSGISTKTAEAIPSVLLAVDAYAKALATMPWNIYRRAGRRKEVASGHPLQRIVHDGANPLLDSFQFWQLKERTQILKGNFYALIVRGPGDVLEALVPLNPDRVEVVQIPHEYDIGYVYKPLEGEKVLIPRDQIFHTREPGEDGIVGRSRIQIAFKTFLLASAFTEHNEALFRNDSRPLGLFVPPQKLSSQQVEALRESWERVHRGAANSGRVGVLPFNMEYKQISMSARDAQLLELMEVTTKDDVAMIFDIPPVRLQDYRKSNFKNSEQADLNWGKHSVSPRVVATERAVNHQLLKDPNYFCKANMSAIYRADIKTRYDSYHTAIGDGWLSRAEVREIEDFDPAEDDRLNEFLVPVNVQTLDQAEARIKAEETAAEQPPAPVEEQQEEPEPEEPELAKTLEPFLFSCLRRLSTKEANAIRRALKKDNFLKVAEEFYNKHGELLRDELSPFSRALGRSPDHVEKWLGQYFNTRIDSLIEMAKENDETLAGAFLANWDNAKVLGEFVKSFIGA